MNFPKLIKITKIQINYKSGVSMKCEYKSFEINGAKYSWEAHKGSYSPFLLNHTEIESMWIIGRRTVISFNE